MGYAARFFERLISQSLISSDATVVFENLRISASVPMPSTRLFRFALELLEGRFV